MVWCPRIFWKRFGSVPERIADHRKAGRKCITDHASTIGIRIAKDVSFALRVRADRDDFSGSKRTPAILAGSFSALIDVQIFIIHLSPSSCWLGG